MSAILELCQGIPLQTYEPGTILLAEGQTSRCLYILVDGEVEIRKGELQVNAVSQSGAIFGEMSVLLGIPHTATVRALRSCHVHVIEDAQTFLQDHKELAYDIAKLLAQRLHGVTTYLADLNRYVRAL